MPLISSFSIRTKLAVLLLPPLLGFGILGVRGAVRSLGNAQDMRQVAELTTLCGQVGGLVHELQKERGSTALFLGSEGRQFKDEVQARRQATDQKLGEFRTFLKAFRADRHSGLKGLVDRAESSLAQLDARRQVASALQTTAKEHLAFYTGLIGSLLEIAHRVPLVAHEPDVAVLGQGYTHLLNGKEQAGRERAGVSNALAAGKITAEAFRSFTALAAGQQEQLDAFGRLVSPELRSWALAQLDQPFTVEVGRIRGAVFEKAASGKFGVEASHWFQVSTERINALKDIEDRLAKELRVLAKRLESSAQREAFATLLAIVLGALVALGLAVAVARDISTSLRQFESRMAAIAEGEADLTARLDEDRGDEIGRIAVHFNRFMDGMTNLVRTIQASSSAIIDSAERISLRSSELARRTEGQAASLEETAASLEELASNVHSTNENAARSSAEADQTRRLGEESGEHTRHLAESMKTLHLSSLRVSEISSLVNEIAFQTNLLALNAAVEAARAGEQGRGFAVVAAEVRSLAKRASEAVKEIRSLVQGEVEGVANGLQMAGKVEQGILQIIESTRQVSALMAGIAFATREQSSGLGQVTEAMAQIDGFTQENAQMVLLAESGSFELAAHAQALQEAVGRFRVN